LTRQDTRRYGGVRARRGNELQNRCAATVGSLAGYSDRCPLWDAQPPGNGGTTSLERLRDRKGAGTARPGHAERAQAVASWRRSPGQRGTERDGHSAARSFVYRNDRGSPRSPAMVRRPTAGAWHRCGVKCGNWPVDRCQRGDRPHAEAGVGAIYPRRAPSDGVNTGAVPSFPATCCSNSATPSIAFDFCTLLRSR